ncbi:MAG: MmcQ/YjbR family DNA-binding protein [Solirubrobacterales bacterium]|nr:MmcQ/YjbR family DNA-binding protein [Solirubrobacterales bacterium]MBV9196384.1 MmcQ/YjbR family DNA-binding protein [Solirubrobacterales bacterium]MBV9714787.1 MmcQ/YjbR family DNA-binding protein [Solirubrobacterales bacterium]
MRSVADDASRASRTEVGEPPSVIDALALRALCLSFPGSHETFPFGAETSVFKVAGKMFALSRLGGEPLCVSLKCEPLLAEQLRAAHPAITGGYHLNKRHWNTVVLDGSLPNDMIADMLEDSYDLVVSKLSRARRRALRWHPEQDAAPGRKQAGADHAAEACRAPIRNGPGGSTG